MAATRTRRARGGTRRPTRPVQARSEETRARILEAALALLAEQGPGAVTHRQVAAAAGVSLGSTTYYFGTRDQLLEEVFRLHLAAVRERAESTYTAFGGDGDMPASAEADAGTALAAYLERDLREGRQGALAAFELALGRARDPALRRRLRPAAGASDAFAAEMLGRLGSPAPDLDARLLSAAIVGLKLECLAEGERSALAKQLPALARRLAELLLP